MITTLLLSFCVEIFIYRVNNFIIVLTNEKEVLIVASINERITALREQRGWSKTFVAKKLGLNLSTYANYEYCNREPDIKTLSDIAKLFNTSIDYLIGQKKQEDKHVDIKNDPVVLSYGGKPISKEDMDVIKAILARHQD